MWPRKWGGRRPENEATELLSGKLLLAILKQHWCPPELLIGQMEYWCGWHKLHRQVLQLGWHRWELWMSAGHASCWISECWDWVMSVVSRRGWIVHVLTQDPGLKLFGKYLTLLPVWTPNVAIWLVSPYPHMRQWYLANNSLYFLSELGMQPSDWSDPTHIWGNGTMVQHVDKQHHSCCRNAYTYDVYQYALWAIMYISPVADGTQTYIRYIIFN